MLGLSTSAMGDIGGAAALVAAPNRPKNDAIPEVSSSGFFADAPSSSNPSRSCSAASPPSESRPVMSLAPLLSPPRFELKPLTPLRSVIPSWSWTWFRSHVTATASATSTPFALLRGSASRTRITREGAPWSSVACGARSSVAFANVASAPSASSPLRDPRAFRAYSFFSNAFPGALYMVATKKRFAPPASGASASSEGAKRATPSAAGATGVCCTFAPRLCGSERGGGRVRARAGEGGGGWVRRGGSGAGRVVADRPRRDIRMGRKRATRRVSEGRRATRVDAPG